MSSAHPRSTKKVLKQNGHIIKCVLTGWSSSSETHGLLVDEIVLERRPSALEVKFSPKISLTRKNRIVPTSSPWVSNDGWSRAGRKNIWLYFRSHRPHLARCDPHVLTFERNIFQSGSLTRYKFGFVFEENWGWEITWLLNLSTLCFRNVFCPHKHCSLALVFLRFQF